MNARLLICLILLPVCALAQGFADLGRDAEGFAQPNPSTRLAFPADHGPHPAYRIEWWYLTANLTGPDGTPYGLQWTLFRTALAPETGEGWSTPQIWFGHAAVTSAEEHHVAERFARGGIGQAGVRADPFEAWIDDWQMAGDTLDDLTLSASGLTFTYDLRLKAEGPLVLHGAQGHSVKSLAGQASHYYSQPFFAVSGTITLPDGDVPVSGHGWLDREWSSQPLTEDQSGWDWFSLSFETGDKLMGFRLRQDDGSYYTSGTWIGREGETVALPDGSFAATPLDTTPVADREVPTRWHVTVAERGVDVTVAALNPHAWMAVSLPYWEGPVVVSGSHAGVGYLEMTGYE
jgi:predicted secreted hydrolase